MHMEISSLTAVVNITLCIFFHELIIELFKAIHDRRHLLLCRQDGCPQMEDPASATQLTAFLSKENQRFIRICQNKRRGEEITLPSVQILSRGRWKFQWLPKA